MDAMVAAQLATVLLRLADGALGEVGKQAWDALARLVGHAMSPRAQVRSVSAGEALAELEAHPGDVARAEAVGQALARLAAADPEFAVLLSEWLTSTDRLVCDRAAGSHANIIRGGVQGPVVQARDIHGPVSFGDGLPTS